MKKNQISFLFIIVLASLGFFATDIYIPSLPAVSKYFNSDPAYSKLTISSYLLSFSIAPLIFGPISDRFGRKTVITIGLILGLTATAFCYFSNAIYWLIFFRFFQGLSLGAVDISSRSMFPDLFSGPELAKKLSYFFMLLPVFLSIASVLGGYLQEKFNWQAVFLFVIIYISTILVSTKLLPESLEKKSDKKVASIIFGYKELLKNKPFMLYTICTMIISFGIVAYFTVSPFLFQVMLKMSPFEYGKLAIYIAITIMLSSYINAKIINVFSLRRIMHFSVFLILFSGFLLLTFHFIKFINILTILIPALVFLMSIPFCSANGFSKALDFVDEDYGSATGLISSLQFLGGAFGSFVFSIIPTSNVIFLGIGFIVCGIIIFMLLHFVEKIEKI